MQPDPHVASSSTNGLGTDGAHAGSSALARIGWMAIGSVMMVCGAFSIASVPHWTFGWRDLLFWFGALFAVALRYLDISRFGGQTANGEPATMAHFRRYFIGVAIVGLAAWAAAHSLHL